MSDRNCPLQNGFLEVNNLTWFESEIFQLLHVDVSESLGAGICMCPEFCENLIRQAIGATKHDNILFASRLKIWGDEWLQTSRWLRRSCGRYRQGRQSWSWMQKSKHVVGHNNIDDRGS
jgi:hypothetical protein